VTSPPAEPPPCRTSPLPLSFARRGNLVLGFLYFGAVYLAMPHLLQSSKTHVMTCSTLTPAVPNKWLYFIAGVMWSAVGILMCVYAFSWIAPLGVVWEISDLLAGCVLALLAYKFAFSGLALKNIRRISAFTKKTCVFAFQAWKSYLIIVFMVALGVTLRHSAFPKKYLAVLYFSIGGALFFSSIHYYTTLRKVCNHSNLTPR
jgi:hypothetical protein